MKIKLRFCGCFRIYTASQGRNDMVLQLAVCIELAPPEEAGHSVMELLQDLLYMHVSLYIFKLSTTELYDFLQLRSRFMSCELRASLSFRTS